jgi:hypothetical protein
MARMLLGLADTAGAESEASAEPREGPSLAVWSARPIFDLQAL